MNVCIYSQFRRFSFRCLMTTIVALCPLAVRAGDFDCGSDIVPATSATTPCDFELVDTEELCGWVEYSPLGTHDSGVLPTPAVAKIPPAPIAPVQKTRSLEKSVAAIATATLASAGVSVEQIAEPFAMVGPYLDNSVARVREFQSWWQAAVEEAKSAPNSHEESIQNDLNQIAEQEPVDVESFGPSVIVDSFPAAPAPSIEITAIDPLVGGSAIIATIEDAYLPYDLSARDLKLWSVFPTSTQPFCVRTHINDMPEAPMWKDFDLALQTDTPAAPSLETCNASADCLMYELVWEFESLIAEDSAVWAAIEPRNIGRGVAVMATDGSRIVETAAHLLASSWPESSAEPAPSDAGGALLARAGAVEASEPAVAPEIQIAELPSANRY